MKSITKVGSKDTQNGPQTYEERYLKSKNLKVALYSNSETGHFMPIAHIAEALLEKGHDVHVVFQSA